MEKFSLEENGYNKEEVNSFLNDIIVRYESLIDKYNKKEEEVVRLQNELNELNNNSIINNAKMEASRILNESLIKANSEEENAKLLRRNISILRRKMDILIKQEEAIMKEFDDLEESN